MEKNIEKVSLEALRHSASHIMAYAVKELFPGTKFGIGPPIENGFYYDFDTPTRITEEDLPKIEQKMMELIKADYKFIRKEFKKEEAKNIFKDQKYKIELIEEIPDETVSIYETGDFIDLCKGPHVNSSGEIKHFKLLSISGVYWRADEEREQLQRIYGTAFFTEEELNEYLKMLEEAKKRDHRKLGTELEIYEINEDFGPGLVLWRPKGAILREIIENYWKKLHLENGYEPVITPHVARINLWKISGHIDFYSDYIYSPMKIDTQDYIIKPMNCPGHILIFKSKLHSYKELPVRYYELGTVYRYERSGVLHGLLRVRGFTQDDAHIFCTKEQIKDEIIKVLNLALNLLSDFGFKEYDIGVSTRPDSFIGDISIWGLAEQSLFSALNELNIKYKINPKEGVFYGPKIDIKIKDCLGRLWQCSTIQIDFNLPDRFDVTYRDKNNQPERVIMIHRALMGSLERFIGVLLEHYAGWLPIWLSPVQVKILSISENQLEYTQKIANELMKNELRVKTDTGPARLAYKLRTAILEKVPYHIIIGDKEVKTNTISVRKKEKDLGNMSLDNFIKIIKEDIKNRI